MTQTLYRTYTDLDVPGTREVLGVFRAMSLVQPGVQMHHKVQVQMHRWDSSHVFS